LQKKKSQLEVAGPSGDVSEATAFGWFWHNLARLKNHIETKFVVINPFVCPPSQKGVVILSVENMAC
jgi:hypothetical protein